MKILVSLLFFLILIHQAAVAGTIFKCKDAKGVVAFQQVACPAGQGIGAKSFQRVPDSPNQAPNDTREELIERLEAIVAKQEQAAAPRVGGGNGQGEAPPSGFVCDDGRTRWVQSKPCPASTEHYETHAINGTTNTGVPVHGTTRQKVINPVEQKSLSRAEICEQLRNNSATKSTPGASASEAYERNKLRDANGCY